MELFHAANQWATRPADERFSSLESMRDACHEYYLSARESTVRWQDLRVEARGEELALVGKAGVPATLTHHAFGQLAGRVGAPAGYLRSLAPTLAAQNLNYGLANRSEELSDAKLLVHANGSLLLRAATTEHYSRIWNWEVLNRLIQMSQRYSLVPAQQTFCWSGGAVPADAPKALYASDHDMFAFVMSQERDVTDPLGHTLRRGVIVVNSEVGDKSLQFMGFLFRDVCANHIIWGAQNLAEVRLTHVGDIAGRMQRAQLEVRRYLDGAATIDQAKMERTLVKIGEDRDAVLDKLFGMRQIGMSRKLLAESYDAVVPEEDGDPRTVWGMAQGITRRSQEEKYAEDRQNLDRVAGKLLSIAF